MLQVLEVQLYMGIYARSYVHNIDRKNFYFVRFLKKDTSFFSVYCIFLASRNLICAVVRFWCGPRFTGFRQRLRRYLKSYHPLSPAQRIAVAICN